ncbi:MAG: S24/S26 family peptidase [Oscillospiraceae bacterium]|nr:S24/S26 family peptidase [Oscillospiraceae bacterium]
MEHNVKVVPSDVMTEHICELLEETDNVPLVISGSSMSPFLVHGRDTVYLSKIRSTVKRGNMIFYRRDNGKVILHRVIKVKENGCDMVGDAQTVIEPNVSYDNMIAVVTAVTRKGKLLKRSSICWLFFEKLWIRMIKLRPFIVKVYTKLVGR